MEQWIGSGDTFWQGSSRLPVGNRHPTKNLEILATWEMLWLLSDVLPQVPEFDCQMEFRHKGKGSCPTDLFFVDCQGEWEGTLPAPWTIQLPIILIRLVMKNQLSDVLSSSPIWETFWKCRHLEQWFHFCALSEWLMSQHSPWILISKQLLVWRWTGGCGAERLLCLQIRPTDMLHIDIYLIFLTTNNLEHWYFFVSVFCFKKNLDKTIAVNTLSAFQMHSHPLIKQKGTFGSCSVWFQLSRVPLGSSFIWFGATCFWSIHWEHS